jgi:shikimate kinase
MRLSRSELLDQYRDGRLRLALIGMCNSGQSRLSSALARELGFRRISVDDEIERVFPSAGRLDRRATAAPSSRARQRRNLEHEAACLDALALPARDSRANVILDTTGSTAHLPEATTRALRARFLVVYLEVPADEEEGLVERLLETPKDLYWGDFYHRRDGEPIAASVRRCFPALYAWRKSRYERLADVTVPAGSDGALTAETLWTLLLDGLEACRPSPLPEEPADGLRP